MLARHGVAVVGALGWGFSGLLFDFGIGSKAVSLPTLKKISRLEYSISIFLRLSLGGKSFAESIWGIEAQLSSPSA